jgi:hypothetical protein
MAWTFDAASGTGGITEVDADATVTLSFTVGTLTSGVLWVGAAWATTATTATGVTYNGVAMTEASSQATNRGVTLWRLEAPASGANNIVMSGSGNFGRVCLGAISYDGANATQTPQIATPVSGTGTGPSITSLTGATELVIDVLGISFTAGDTLTVGANQTERVKITGGATTLAMSSQLGSDGGVMSWTDSNSRAYGMVAASFDMAADAAVTPKTLAALGVG